jgi:hypothetical protein
MLSLDSNSGEMGKIQNWVANLNLQSLGDYK